MNISSINHIEQIGRQFSVTFNSTPKHFEISTLVVLILSVFLANLYASDSDTFEASGRPPNILVFLTDDQNYRSLGASGNPAIQTPNIDALAAEGVTFANAFVTTSICAVNRASLLTGQHMRRHGIDDFETPLSVEAFAQTYPALLRAAGYKTAYIGKFAIGSPREPWRELSLPEQAFDHWYGFPQSISYRQEIDGKSHYLTTKMIEHAIDFLQQSRSGRPFMLTIGFKEPHGPYDYFDPEVTDPYAKVNLPIPSTFTREHFENLPVFLRESLNARNSEMWLTEPATFQDFLRRRYRLISRVDLAVGRVMSELRESGLDDNTVVLFSSDNGYMVGQRALGEKWLMYEDSIRVPLIIRDPRLPPTRAGRKVEDMVLSIDIAPTLLTMAGLPAPKRMQGNDFGPLLRGENVTWRKEWFYEHTYQVSPSLPPIPRSEGVRTEQWKYIRYPDQSPVYEQLFDLYTDPDELHNLASDPAMIEQLERLRARCDFYRKSLI